MIQSSTKEGKNSDAKLTNAELRISAVENYKKFLKEKTANLLLI
jgi:hypothetical protein